MKEGIFSTEISKMIEKAFEIRNDSDYDDMFIASKSETETQVNNAKHVYQEIENYLQQFVKG